jgi:hypothetical protein
MLASAQGAEAVAAKVRRVHASTLESTLRRLAMDPANQAAVRLALIEAETDPAVAQADPPALATRLWWLVRTGRLALFELARADLGTFGGDVVEEAPESAGPEAPPRTVLTWIAIELTDEEGAPIPGEAYRVELPDGSVREGRLDGSGAARIDDIDPGTCVVTFPRFDEEAWVPR